MPAVTFTAPTRELSGQVPASALASGQVGTPLRLPARPGGRFAVTLLRFWSLSVRLTVIVVAPAGRPAAVLSAETLSAGVKPKVQP